MRAVFALFAGLLVAADWPQFRGPDGSGIAPDSAEYPVEWSAEKNLLWTAELPGPGVSSPIVFAGKVFVTATSGYREERLHVLAFDEKTGRKLWHRQLLATGNTTCHPKTSMAAPTPVADESGVYALFATGDVAAFTPDGGLKWYRSLAGDYPQITNQVGMASSPILWNDRLIVPMDNAGDSFLAALDSEYGENVWRIPRPRKVNWVTPTVRRAEGRDELLFQSPDGLTAYDPATGKELWKFGSGAGSIPSTVVGPERIYATIEGVTAIEPTGEGRPRELWKSQRLRSQYGSPLLYKGSIFSINSSGVLVSADPATGEARWQERIPKGQFSASLVAADDKLYAVAEDGTTTVFQVDDDGAEILASNSLEGSVLATPALANGRIFIRAEATLYCVGK